MKKLMLVAMLGLILGISGNLEAGNLEPSWGPQSGSGMYTLSEVYYYLTEGTEGSVADSFQEPSAGPGSTMMDTKVIYDDIKAEFDQCGAEPGDVLSGTTFFSTDNGNWGPQSGTVETRTLSDQTDVLEGGYYVETSLHVVDVDLATGNIKNGVTIFGVLGTYSGGGGGGGLPKTGQFVSYTDYDDAYYANPATYDIGNPMGLGSWAAYTADGGRFTDNGDSTVTDNATGLMWAADGSGAGCYSGGTLGWADALTWAESLEFAEHTDWRLPNSQELYSIVDCSTISPAIDNNFFPNTQLGYYRSSTTYAGSTTNAWIVDFNYGYVSNGNKNNYYYVRAVRDGK